MKSSPDVLWTNVAALMRGRRRQRMTRPFLFLIDHLSSLLAAGVPLQDALACLRHSCRTKALHGILTLGQESVEQGKALSQAWCHHLPELLQVMLTAGEKSGDIAPALRSYVDYARWRDNSRGEWVRVVSYPLALVCLITGLTIFVSTVLLPTFQSIYSSLDLRPSSSTVLVETALADIPAALLFLFTAIVGTAAILAGLRQLLPPNRWAQVFRLIPGTNVLQLSRTRLWCLTLRMLVCAGVPLAEALSWLSAPGGPLWLQEAAKTAFTEVMAGQRLSEAVGQSWDPMLSVLLQWAELTGELTNALGKAETYCETLLRSRLKSTVHIVEPILLGLMGLLVTCAMYVVYVPMYDMMTSVAAGPSVHTVVNGGN